MRSALWCIAYVVIQTGIVIITTQSWKLSLLTAGLAILGLVAGLVMVRLVPTRKDRRLSLDEPQSGWTEYSRMLIKKVEADRERAARDAEQNSKRVTRGFTLAELLIVIALLAILGAGAAYSFRHASTQSRASPWGCQC